MRKSDFPDDDPETGLPPELDQDAAPKLKKRLPFRNSSFVFPFVAAILYGLVMRLSYGASSAMSTLTFGFLALMPIALGAITVFLMWRTFRVGWFQAFIAPWLPGTAFLLGVVLINLEIAICLLMILPIFLIATSIGALVMNAVMHLADRLIWMRRSSPSLLAMLLLAPYLVTAVENRAPLVDDLRVVSASVVINADAMTVWEQIIRVPEILPGEGAQRFSHVLGVPRPVEAVLDGEGVGARRQGRFSNGLLFNETITAWEPGRYVHFTVQIDRAGPLPAPYEALGGPIDILDAAYRIEPLAEGGVRLTLLSTHRLTTHINSYARLWTDAFMGDFQAYLLDIIKARCERV